MAKNSATLIIDIKKSDKPRNNLVRALVYLELPKRALFGHLYAANMTKQGAESGTEKTQRRHCWECLRRRLVCDSTHPICIRCSTRGVICPGYDNSKPLKWLSPGRVTSRNRRLKGASSDKIEDDHNETTTRTKAELFRGTNNVRIPRLEMRTKTCAAVEAVEYCK